MSNFKFLSSFVTIIFNSFVVKKSFCDNYNENVIKGYEYKKTFGNTFYKIKNTDNLKESPIVHLMNIDLCLHHGNEICCIEIPDDANVIISENKKYLKIDKYNKINEYDYKTFFESLDEQTILQMMENDVYIDLSYLRQTPAILKAFIQKYPYKF
jgi:hypothetical protein